MSAFICSNAHINYLVRAAVAYGVIDDDASDGLDAARATVRELARENRRSVNYRYAENKRTPAYEFKPLGFAKEPALDPVVVLKSISCLDYQSCEHDGWAKSAAKKFLTQLERAAINTLPGYNDAPWGI